MPTDPETISAAALTHGTGVFDRAISQVVHQGARFIITRYRRPVAMLVPMPDRIVSDPNEVLAERIENSAENSAKTPPERSVTPRRPA